jgi:hypothetical protein
MINSIDIKIIQILIKSLKINVSLFYHYLITKTELSLFMRYDLNSTDRAQSLSLCFKVSYAKLMLCYANIV